MIVNVRSLKSGLPMIIAITGITRLLTRELTTAANAMPITKATASSTMFPLKRKSLNSWSISASRLDGRSYGSCMLIKDAVAFDGQAT